MSLLIDGYNLLHDAGLMGKGEGPGSLERARRRLLNFLVESLSADELARALVVFDAHDAPPNLPDQVRHRGLAVRFARGYESADALLEELIRQESAPKRLVVVSSDHQVQLAARRRKAQAVDSHVWYERVLSERCCPPPAAENEEERGDALSPDEADELAREFHAPDLDAELSKDQIFPEGYAENDWNEGSSR